MFDVIMSNDNLFNDIEKRQKCLNGIMSGLVPVNQMTLLQTAKILNLK